MKAAGLALALLVAGCAGYRGGWESVAYLGDTPPRGLEDEADAPRPAAELAASGLKLRVTLNNKLRTYDTQVYFFVVPLSVDPRNVYPQDHQPGKTRVHLDVAAEVDGVVFQPSQARLKVGEQEFAGLAGYDFGMWDEKWNRVERGGKWEHRPVGGEMVLREIGRRYLLSIDFPTPVPSPESRDIVLDLSQALKSPKQPPLPAIRFAPARWKEGYT